MDATSPASPPVAAPGRLRRYATVYAALWRNSIVREMGFKTNFLLWIVVELLWFALQLCFVAVIYQHTERIATWSKWEVVLLMGASQFIQQVFTALFFTNCSNLSELVRTGRLDFLLLLPVNTRFVISLRHVDLGAFVNAASAVAVMVYAAGRLGLRPGVVELAAFGALCAAGVLIHYSLMFLLATVSFWTVRAQSIIWGYHNLFNVARLPDAAFRPGMFKATFTFVLPMLLVANVPVKLLADKLDAGWEVLLLLGMTAVCFAVSEWGWRRSVRHYTSASS
ncbi:MAG: ABC-2 family transporter protein [Verrucomicrobia bacterium]|nr:ABC-2 family transporter protein [Verrucomicrobiota bacterium]